MDFLDSYYSQFFDNFNFFFFDKSLFCPGLFSDLLCNDGLTFTSVVYCLSIHSIDFIIVRRRSLFTRNFQKTSFQFRVISYIYALCIQVYFSIHNKNCHLFSLFRNKRLLFNGRTPKFTI